MTRKPQISYEEKKKNVNFLLPSMRGSRNCPELFLEVVMSLGAGKGGVAQG